MANEFEYEFEFMNGVWSSRGIDECHVRNEG